MTRQRDVILRVLRNLQSHPTADELYHAVRKQVPRISLGTVYRNLDVLCEQGLACRLEIGGGQRRYDAGMCPHLHGRCVRCDNVIDLPAETAPPVEIKLPDDLGFQLTEYRLELFGICRSCQEEAAHAENKNRRRLSTN
jgi:Fur family ferric uptake transcriptional regulator